MCAKNLRQYFGLTGGQHPNPLNSFFLIFKIKDFSLFCTPEKKGAWPTHLGDIY